MVEVGRIFRFRALHSLPDFPAPWCFPHMHDYTVEVVLPGGTPTDDVDARWKKFDPIPGENLNALFFPSTVEQIATDMLEMFPEAIRVRVWEDQARWGEARR